MEIAHKQTLKFKVQVGKILSQVCRVGEGTPKTDKLLLKWNPFDWAARGF